MNSVVIRCARLSDLVAVAFYRVGYRPRESLVLLGVTDRRAGVVSRMDLPPARHRRDVVGGQVRAMRREGERQLVALVVSDVPPPGGARGPVKLPHRGLVRELSRQAAAYGCELMEVLAVGASRWRSYRCADLTCCPPQGFSLDEALSGPAAAGLVAEGHVLAPTEEALVADVAPDADGPQAHLIPDADLVGSVGPGPAPMDAVQALSRWRVLLARPEQAVPSDLRWLMDALQDRWLRDAVLLTLIPGSGTVPDEVLAGGDPGVMDDVFAADPDHELLERGRVMLAAVARSAPPGRRADALALLAWAAWWAGCGARGRLLAGRALADVPGHRLAALVDQLLFLGVPPTWVERRRNQAS